ncbi:MAG: sugar ABC transporter ATP-binding protein [Spirochaetes bacterium]|jgi:monosaccharide-transporting ATPase|nr:sugar ABC transporter ATP-binding protein [Spirochaetota bacterium]
MNIITPVLQARNISKIFPGVIALNEVNFNLLPGEIHGLMGENGAGKSTLIKCLTGVYSPDEGDVIYCDNRVFFSSPLESSKAGISTVYQEVNLIPTLSVAENICAGRQPLKKGIINWTFINAHAKELLAMLDVDIDVSASLSEYSTAIQQMVAIARGLDLEARVLILDEPTSSLDEEEARKLFAVIRKLKNDGMGIIFISHFLDQVYEICDRLTVLRNGEYIGEYEIGELSKHELIIKMLGKDLAQFEYRSSKNTVNKKSDKKTFYRVKGLSKRNGVLPFDLDLREGEVLGLGGLLGSGRTEIARLLFGIDKPTTGNASVWGLSGFIKNPKQAVDKSFGFCPEDRKVEGLIPDLTIRENIILALQVKHGLFKYLSVKKQKEIADMYIKLLKIKTPSSEVSVSKLSGGNQQKVIVARWLAANPKFLILDEPTRGIDVGAKVEIQKMILEFKDQGMSILFISSELDEVVRCSDRIAVLRDRHKIAELCGDDISSSTIMYTIANANTNASANTNANVSVNCNSGGQNEAEVES